MDIDFLEKEYRRNRRVKIYSIFDKPEWNERTAITGYAYNLRRDGKNFIVDLHPLAGLQGSIAQILLNVNERGQWNPANIFIDLEVSPETHLTTGFVSHKELLLKGRSRELHPMIDGSILRYLRMAQNL